MQQLRHMAGIKAIVGAICGEKSCALPLFSPPHAGVVASTDLAQQTTRTACDLTVKFKINKRWRNL